LEAATIVLDYGIKKADMATVYMSPDPFFDGLKKTLISANGCLTNIAQPAFPYCFIMDAFTLVA
jgi:hypothetical protein